MIRSGEFGAAVLDDWWRPPGRYAPGLRTYWCSAVSSRNLGTHQSPVPPAPSVTEAVRKAAEAATGVVPSGFQRRDADAGKPQGLHPARSAPPPTSGRASARLVGGNHGRGMAQRGYPAAGPCSGFPLYAEVLLPARLLRGNPRALASRSSPLCHRLSRPEAPLYPSRQSGGYTGPAAAGFSHAGKEMWAL